MRAAFVVGKPGAGKGTQAALLEAQLDLRLISMGDLLRAASAREASRGDPEPAEAMTVGALVPREMSREALLASLEAERGDVVVEGVRRATTLEAGLLVLAGPAAVAGAFIDLPDEVVRKRLEARRWCESCQASYGLLLRPPEEGRCACGHVLDRRPDDHDDTIEDRLEVFRKEEPELARVADDHGFFRVDGNRRPPEVLADLVAGLEQRWSGDIPQSPTESAA